MNGLITAKEIAWGMPADGGQNIDYTRLCEYIVIAEEQYLFDCIGKDMYEALYSDLSSTYPDKLMAASPFNIQKAYAIGDVVVYQKKVYECIVITTAGILPTVSANWTVQPKFGTEKYETLWSNHLRKILAWATVKEGTIPNAYRFSSEGVLKQKTEQTETVTGKELGILSNSQNTKISLLLNRMARFLQDNEDYPLYLGNQKPSEANKHKRSKAGFAFGYNEGSDCECEIKTVEGWAML